MPSKKKPAYLLHKPTGQARVRIDGKDHYLGAFGSPQSREKYDDLIAAWCAENGDLRQYTLTVDELVLLYLDHAEQHYRKNGEPTSEIHCLKLACRRLIALYGTSRVRDFGPRFFKVVRQTFVDKGYVRRTINSLMGRIRRLFRWGVENEYVPVAIYQALCAVTGLQKGRSSATESDPVLPVARETVEATLPYLTPVVATMVRLQLLTGMRPNEVCVLRPCDLSRQTDGLWAYRPASHKTEHHDRERRIFIGPEGQKLLQPYLDRGENAYCFSPSESENYRQAARRAARRSPMTPSQRARVSKENGQRHPRHRFDVCSYRRAIARACELAFDMPDGLRKSPPKNELGPQKTKRLAEAAAWRKEYCWSPNQLRHSRATLIREQFGIEAAQVVLGHSDPRVTEIYAERDFALAAKIMRQIG